ncbi:hypothetical protein B0H11DRAFT_1921235 [Mycena galericulata]|nr:hypothetical protein B0H11DRAFT_1921235 [Mycena galericulata]
MPPIVKSGGGTEQRLQEDGPGPVGSRTVQARRRATATEEGGEEQGSRGEGRAAGRAVDLYIISNTISLQCLPMHGATRPVCNPNLASMPVTRTLPFSRPTKLRPMRAVRLEHLDPLDKWLGAADIKPSPVCWDFFPDNIPVNDEVICEVYMGVYEDILGTIYTLNLEAYDHGTFTGLIRLASYSGSARDADAPLWARRLPLQKFGRLLQPREFVAKLVAGMTDIPVQRLGFGGITPEMLSWARQCAIGTPAQRLLSRRCKNAALGSIRTWKRGKNLRGL